MLLLLWLLAVLPPVLSISDHDNNHSHAAAAAHQTTNDGRMLLQRLSLTCVECEGSFWMHPRRVQHRLMLPFAALRVYVHATPHSAKTQIYVDGTLIPWPSVPPPRVLFDYRRVVNVTVVEHRTRRAHTYAIELRREPEPQCGIIYRTRSLHQRITLTKGIPYRRHHQHHHHIHHHLGGRWDGCRGRPHRACQRYQSRLWSRYGALSSSSSINNACDDSRTHARDELSGVCPLSSAVHLYLNGEIQLDTSDDGANRLMVHTPLTYAKRLRNILIVGGAFLSSALMLRAGARHFERGHRFVTVELDEVLVDLWTNHPFVRRLNGDAFRDPRVQVVVGDGIGYLLNSTTQWDVIVDSCEVDVSTQPRGFRDRYKLYLRALVSKLAPGGVSTIMHPIDNDIEEERRQCFDTLYMDTRAAVTTMQRLTRVDRMGAVGKKAHREHGVPVYTMSQVVQHGDVGPEHHVFFSNEPFVRRRQLNDDMPASASHDAASSHAPAHGGWCHKVIY